MKTGKQIGFLLLALGMFFPVAGQEPVSLTNDGLVSRTDKGFYLSVDFRQTALGGEPVRMNGGTLAFLHKQWFSAGGVFYATPYSFSYENRFYDFSYGGLCVQALLNPQKLIFLSAGVSGGIGYLHEVAVKDKVGPYLELESRLWMNITSFMRVSLLAAYRLSDNQVSGFESSGESFGFSVAYGKF